MTNFSDLGIEAAPPKSFVGDKIPVKKLLNISIEVKDYLIEPSKLKEGTQCLKLQIVKSGELRVVFTGSKGLLDQIKKVPKEKFPFFTTIREENECFFFS